MPDWSNGEYVLEITVGGGAGAMKAHATFRFFLRFFFFFFRFLFPPLE